MLNLVFEERAFGTKLRREVSTTSFGALTAVAILTVGGAECWRVLLSMGMCCPVLPQHSPLTHLKAPAIR